MGMNEFDQLLEDMNQSSPSNPFDQMLDQQDTMKQRAIQSSAMVAVDTQPDRRAEVMKLSERYKLAPELVENNFDTLSRKSKIESVQPDKLVRDHRGLSDWLSDPNNMALASDELDKLKDLSETINEQGDFEKLYLALGSGFANLNSSVAKIPAMGVDLYTQYAVNPMARALGYAEVGPNEALRNNAVTNFFDNAAEGYAAQVPELSDKVIENALAGDFKKSSRALAFQVAANFPQMALTIGSTMAGAPGVGLAAMGGMSAASEYDEALDKGVDQGAAMANAVIAGSAEAAFERMGTIAILKKWEASIGAKLGKDTARKIMADAGKMLGVSIIQEGAEETGTSLVQDASKIATGVNPDIGRMEIASNAANAFVLGGAMGGAMVAPSGFAMGAQRSLEMRRAQELQDFYTALGDKTNELKLKKRLPEASQKLIENLTKDGPVENIFVDPKDMQTYFQSKNMDPLEAATLYGFAKEYQEAVETGTDVKIPLAKWTTTMAETEHFQGLKDDVRFSPDGLSVRENQKIEKQLKADLKLIASQEEDSEVGKPEAELTPDQKRIRSARAVKENVKQQLLALNSPLYGPNEAEQVALLYAKGFNSLGYRSGTDPLELFNRYNLRISLGEDGQIKEQFSRDTLPTNPASTVNEFEVAEIQRDDGGAIIYDAGNLSALRRVISESEIIQGTVKRDGEGFAQGFIGGTSTFPEFFKNKGYTKQSVLKAIDKQMAGESLTEKQRTILDDLYEGYVDSLNRGEMYQSSLPTELFQSAAQAVADVFPRGEGFELFQSKPQYGTFTPPANVKTATINSLIGEAISMDQARAAVLGTQESIEAKLPGGGTVLITKDTFGKSTFEGGVRDLTPEEKQASAIIAKNLPSLLEDIVIDAQERNYKPDLKPHVKDYRRFYGVVEIDGSEFAFHLKTERPVKGQKAKFKHERVYFEFARKLETPSRNAEANSSEGLKVNQTVRPLKNSPGKAEISIGEFEAKINSVRASDPYFQSGEAEDSNRARIVIGANKTMRIELFAKADLSSFLHETGHFYLEVLADLAKDPRANPQLVADYNTAIKELGGEPGGPITVEMHEKWARAFELYLAKGEAPSLDLKKAFAHFKVWLINVYKNLRRLDVELTPEIKGVMDRLLATDAELEAAYLGHPPLFKGDAFDGMNPETAEKYQKAIEDAKQEASESLTAKVVEREFKKREAAYKEKRKAVRARIEEEANGLRIYRALSILQKGTLPDGAALPEGTPQIKLDKQSIVQAYGKEFLDRLPRPFVYAKEGGVDYNMAAEMLGFESGDAMLTEMANAQPKKAYIEARTDEEMDILYPDEVMEQFPAEAVKAAHSEGRSKLLRMELELLVQNNLPVFKDAIRRVARRVPTEAEVRAQARQLIAGKRIAEIKPYTFERAEVKSAKEAGIALAKGDIEAAFEHKRRELLNHELFRAANEAIEEHEKALEFFKKFGQKDEDLAKSRDMDLVNAGRAILSEYDIGKSEKTREEILKYMQAYAPESFESISTLIDSVGLKPGNFDEITHEEFSKLNETVRAIWTLSRQAKNIEIDGKKVAREEIKAELVAQIDAIKKPGERLGYDKAVSDWEKTKLRLQGMKAALRRVESWVSAVDGKFGGPFRKYIWQPIADATAIYRSEKVKVLTQLQDSIKQWQKESEITTAPIKSNLGYTFAGKAELMAAILHTGNKSNMEKLLIGRGWGQILEDGTLDTSRWDEFMLSMYRTGVITKADMDFAQRVWDLNESLKPAAQKAHKEMYGFYFNEVTADEIQTPFGNYRGGYVPAITDPTMVEDAAIRQEQEAVLKGNNSFMFPTTGRGFTKSRVEQYHAPLMLDLKLTGSHIDKVLRFIHIEPRVKEVSRIVMDKKFRASLAELDPTIGQDMLVPWLQRAAQQAVSTPSKGWAGKGLDTFARELRKRAGLQAMFFNVTNTFQQVTGFSIAAVRVKPKYLRNAMWRYIQSPKAFADDVNSKSKFMETRTGTQMVDINQTIEEIALNTSKFDDVRSYVQKHGYFMQSAAQNLVDLTVWAGAYEQAVVDGMAEVEAVRFADAAVRETQGSMAPEDISRFEAGSPFVRLFTMFQGYFNMQANLLGTEFVKTARDMGLKKGAGRLFYLYVMGFMIPAWMSELIVKGMGSGIDEDDDEQYLDDLLMSFFTSQFNTATAMFPAVGPAARSVVTAFNDKPYDDRLSVSPVVQSIERSAQAPMSVYNAIVNDGSKRKAVRDAMSAVGLLSGIPTGVVQRPLSYLADVDEGKADPAGPVDFTRGLITGNPGTPQ